MTLIELTPVEVEVTLDEIIADLSYPWSGERA